MNKTLVKSLLAASLAISTCSLGAYTNKTTLTPRAIGVNLPLEYTIFHEREAARLENRFGANLQIVPFYGQNTCRKELGKYFGVKDSNTVNLTDFNFPAAYHIDDTDKLTTEPKYTAYGADINYYQNLDKLVKGLYFAASLPIARVETDMQLKVEGTNKEHIVNYLKGDTLNANTSKLEYAKIDGKRGETGVADLDLKLGYKILNKERYHFALNIGLTIPTGNETEGKYVFEPIVGNGKHFALGGGLDGRARIWGEEDHNFELNIKADYRYLFQHSGKRTLGYKDKNAGQYHMLSTDAAYDDAFFPVANKTTLNVDITPGSQLDAIAALAYNKGGFTLDLGYNLYFRQEESLKIKDSFNDTAYYYAADNLFTKDDHIDVTAAETPSQFTNGIFGAVGYTFKNWDYPLMVGLGGKYEFASKNNAVEGWQAWIKAGLSF